MGIGLGKTVVSVLCGFREILGFVFSKNCIGCDVENQKVKHFLCADCKADIGFIRQPFFFSVECRQSCRTLFHIKNLSVGFTEKILTDLIRRGVWGFMTQFCEQRFTTLIIIE